MELEIEGDGLLRRSVICNDAYEACIASPSRNSHAAFLHELHDGTLLCVWFSGSQEGRPDVSIYCSRLEVGSNCWTQAEKITENATHSEQNPALYSKSNNELWLLHTSQEMTNRDTSIVKKSVSYDHGRTWSVSQDIFGEQGLYIRHAPLDIGRSIVLPVYYCGAMGLQNSRANPGANDISAVKISDDGGVTWKTNFIPSSTGAVQMNILPFKGRLHGLFRDRYAQTVKLSISEDCGHIWSDLIDTNLPSNNSSFQAIHFGDDAFAVVYNDSASDKPPTYDGEGTRKAIWGVNRWPLSLAISYDGGFTWMKRRDLVTGSSIAEYAHALKSAGGKTELSYPVMLQSRDGFVHVAYTYHRLAIKYFRFPASVLVEFT